MCDVLKDSAVTVCCSFVCVFEAWTLDSDGHRTSRPPQVSDVCSTCIMLWGGHRCDGAGVDHWTLKTSPWAGSVLVFPERSSTERKGRRLTGDTSQRPSDSAVFLSTPPRRLCVHRHCASVFLRRVCLCVLVSPSLFCAPSSLTDSLLKSRRPDETPSPRGNSWMSPVWTLALMSYVM